MNQPDHIFCPIRRCWVLLKPEEMVRQYWIQLMIQELGYPSGGFVLEKSLRQLPHLALTSLKLPSRRSDIIFFAKGIHSQNELHPLLLMECKAVPLTAKGIRQVVGYNFYVQAPFIAIVNQTESRLGWFEHSKGSIHFESEIPAYQALLAKCQAKNFSSL